MNELTCREIDELLPGYASDALEEDERCVAASHLAECRNHDTELSALRRGFASLATSVEPVEPPAALRDSLLGAFDRELAGAPAVLPSRAPARPSRLVSVTTFGYALAAGLLLLAVGLGIWGASRGGEAGQVLSRTTSDPSGSVTVTYIPAKGLGVIDYDLSAAPAGRVYQAWHIDASGTPVSLGVVSGQQGSIGLTGDMARGGAVAFTVEPPGGSRLPTTTPLLVTELSES